MNINCYNREDFDEVLHELGFSPQYLSSIYSYCRYEDFELNRAACPTIDLLGKIRMYHQLMYIASGESTVMNGAWGESFQHSFDRIHLGMYRSNLGSMTNSARRYDIVLVSCGSDAELESAEGVITRTLERRVTELEPFELTGCKFYSFEKPFNSNNEKYYSNLAIAYKSRSVNIQDVYEMACNAYMYLKYIDSERNLDIPDEYRPLLDPATLNWVTTEGVFDDRLELEIPQAIIDGREEQIKIEAQRKAEEEARREAERQELMNNIRASALEDSVKALGDFQVLDNSCTRLRDIESKMHGIQTNIRDYERSVIDYRKQLEALQIEYNSYLFGVKEKAKSLQEQLKDYLSPDSPIKYVEANEVSCSIYLMSPIIYWEQDELEQWKTVDSGQYYKVLQVITSGRYQLMTSCRIKFNNTAGISGSDCSMMDTDSYEALGFINTIQHPHVGRYSCFGNNETDIRNAIFSSQYDLAINIMIQCAAQLNLTDGCVVRTLCDALTTRDNNHKCFLDTETGKYYSLDEVISMEGTNEVH